MNKPCDCCGKKQLIGFNEKIEPKNYICNECEAVYEKVRLLKSERNLHDDKPIFIVYATSDWKENTWIESVYMDSAEGFAHMEKMQCSDEYGHLNWSNKNIKVKK